MSYPSTLPGPTTAPFQPDERRLLTTLPGPRIARAMQRDRKGRQTVDFIFTQAELDVFLAWLDDSLVRAGAWFAADWPQPQGGTGVRRFVAEPSFPTFYANIGWHVAAECELRGVGQLPYIPTVTFITLDARTDAGPTSEVGIAFAADPARTYSVRLATDDPAHLAWSGLSPTNWVTRFGYETTGGITFGGSLTSYATASLAAAAYEPISISGYSSYQFWIPDNSVFTDNLGGLKLRIEG